MVDERCAGLDVQKKSVMACLITPTPSGGYHQERHTCSTMTPDLLRLHEWLNAQQGSQVAMESTGVFWKPILIILEGQMDVMVVNAHHITTVPGRKTDSTDGSTKNRGLSSRLFPIRIDALDASSDNSGSIGSLPTH